MRGGVIHGDVRLEELGRAAGLTHSMLGGSLDRLDEMALPGRRADPTDGRITRIDSSAVVRKTCVERLAQLSRGPLERARKRGRAGARCDESGPRWPSFPQSLFAACSILRRRKAPIELLRARARRTSRGTSTGPPVAPSSPGARHGRTATLSMRMPFWLAMTFCESEKKRWLTDCFNAYFPAGGHVGTVIWSANAPQLRMARPPARRGRVARIERPW